MTVKELAQKTKWSEVRRAIKYHYPTDKNDYTEVFEWLKTARKGKIESGEVIEIYCAGDILDEGERYYGIHTKKPTDPAYWSLSFRSWNELAHLPIAEETIQNNTNAEILAHFIWEITYYGNRKQMRDTAKELFHRAAKVKEANAL